MDVCGDGSSMCVWEWENMSSNGHTSCVEALRDAAGSSECGHGATTVLSSFPGHCEALQDITCHVP